MMADRYRGGIYTGVTADLGRRIYQHKDGAGSEFVAKYGFNRLVYAEPYERIDDAIAREKAIKKWRRAWKIELIEAANPEWQDLCGIPAFAGTTAGDFSLPVRRRFSTSAP